MYFTGLIVGAAIFLIIGICHPLVIWAEYYMGKKSWWLFLIGGIIASVCSIFIANLIFSCVVAAFGFSLLWGVGEVFHQEKRVLKGWFPENPKRKEYYDKIRNK